MGLNSWWKNRADKAESFLTSGVYNDVVRNRPFQTFTGRDEDGAPEFDNLNGCTSSSQCPAGYACINGVCTFMNSSTETGGGQAGSPGDCGSTAPNSPSPCNSGGPGSCQQTPSCGDGDPSGGQSCCGERCCSYGSLSSSRPGVYCWCGKCPPWPSCSSFCSGYLAANGTAGAGCTSGGSGNSCDECSYCDFGACKEKIVGGPCYCNDGKSCLSAGPCYKCDDDPGSATFGQCVEDTPNCQECVTIQNHICPCGIVLDPFYVCLPLNYQGLATINVAQAEAVRRCEEVCPENDCKAPGCTTITRCENAPCLENERQSGFIQVGDEVCRLCESDCEDLPERCEDCCECHCHSDCGPCEICAGDCTCAPDPACAAPEPEPEP